MRSPEVIGETMLMEMEKMSIDRWFRSDHQFNHLYPVSIRPQAVRHWTPLHVARMAVEFLVMENGLRILDIGSGAGKFCLGAAYYKPHADFYGIEQRKDAVTDAETARQILGLKNVFFTHGNFTQLNFSGYDHFYFYNAFYENLAGTDKIDESIVYSVELYNYYNRYLFKRLEQTPVGTKLVTYHSLEHEIPPSFHVADSQMDGLLKFWIKI
jgi:SAM-dependent methyltransferase